MYNVVRQRPFMWAHIDDRWIFLLCSVYLIFVQVEDCVIVPCGWTIAWYQNLLGEAVHLFPAAQSPEVITQKSVLIIILFAR